MSFVFYILAAGLIYFSFKSYRSGVDYLNFFRAEFSRPLSEYTPFATIIVPCKGDEAGLFENLRPHFEHDYPEYELIFVVDDLNDPAVRTIEKIFSESPKPSGRDQLVEAPKAVNSGQKVENIREAVLHADTRSQVFVFADSDVRPAKTWLRHLVTPLQTENVGAATGYRWFISERMSFAGELRSAWNASIASALGPNVKSNFCWGGSTAIRRDVFDRLDIRDRLAGTLSDDFAITRFLNEADLEIRFVPQALTRSHGNCTFRECVEFTTRQMKVTRVYRPHLWLMSFFGSGLFTVVMPTAFLVVLLSRQNTFIVWASIAALLLVSIFSIGKAWLRLKAVCLIIPEAKRQTFPQLTLWLLAPLVFLYNCSCALTSRRMAWRGITYELVSEKETLRIG